jgi:nucleoside-diphosphate-sugar epimerase
MRILIAGASGAIGRPLVRRLRANQHEVFALARSPDFVPALEDERAIGHTARLLPTKSPTRPRCGTKACQKIQAARATRRR